ncbi:MAG: cyclic nucleotide-binding domain-containing protein [Candidatus Wallbacteria bacterium]|nr:cyclic nucleotide-binding domain-containing protein [Candidatus Wallbacteria bacterium]
MDFIAQLRKTPCFADLDPSRLEEIARFAHRVERPAGAVIFATGDTHRLLYLVIEGRVAIQSEGSTGAPVTLLTAGPGEMFGWSAFVPPHSKTAAAVAMEPVELLALEAEKLRELCNRDPSVGYRVCDWLNHTIAERLYAAQLAAAEMRENDRASWVLAFP